MLLNYHIGRFVLGSMCVGDLVRLGLSGVRVAGFSMQHGYEPTLPCHTPSYRLKLFSSQTFSRINTPTFLKFRHTSYLPAYEDGTDRVPKRRHIKFIHRGITQKKAYMLYVNVVFTRFTSVFSVISKWKDHFGFY